MPAPPKTYRIATTNSVVTDVRTVRDKVWLMLDNYANQIEKDCSGCLDITVLIIEMVETNPHMADQLRNLFEELTSYLAAILDEGKKQGEIDTALDSRMTAYAIVGNLEGLTVQYYLNRNNIQYGRLIEAYKNLVLNGLFSA